MQDGCRFCSTPLMHSFCDLGMTPWSNSYLSYEDLDKSETFYPLHAHVCSNCFLVQIKGHALPERVFTDYAYFSSYSKTWLEHAKRFVHQVQARFRLDVSKKVIEIASNDGYLLQFFKELGFPVLGIEPAANIAAVAKQKNIPTLNRFFNSSLARELRDQGTQADLLIGNNVLAHVPDLNDFVKGIKILLNSNGLLTMEFPHLLRLIEENQFDTIYHEHFSYFSLLTVERIFTEHGLTIFDAEELPTHGGSLRIYAGHTGELTQRMLLIKAKEKVFHLDKLSGYQGFASKVELWKSDFLRFVLNCQTNRKSIVGYGAPAKGNTLLNFCGIRSSSIPFTVDKSPYKEGQFLPGSHIPILAVQEIFKKKPDYLLILPWNLKTEIMEQMAGIREWGGKFVIPMPRLEVL